MNALDRAQMALTRAARRAGVIIPDSATSPMDQDATQVIPRVDLEDTVVIHPGWDAGSGR